jgi:Amt family ammonium transporter
MTPLEIDTGTTAWLLASAALVLLMTPGLAFFYGGMVRAKSVLNMMMMSFGALASIAVIWILWGYSTAFGDDIGYGLLGDPVQYLGLKGLMGATSEVSFDDQTGIYPVMAFVAFQAVFAIITVALISGAIADRAKFSTWMIFTVIWGTIVYFPIAHWVFDFSSGEHVGGWIANNLKAIDFAGGTAVHINAGAAGLALAIILGKRLGWKRDPMRPHNLTLVMLGAGLLWFGWFGFNAGSAIAAGTTAATVWVNTMVATAAASLSWLITERIRDGHATSLGAASGVVAGLVAITPSCSSVSPVGAIIVGALAGVICALAIGLKYKLGFDDSLDVVGVHLFGGLWGTLAVGFLATEAAPAGVNRSLLRRRFRSAVATGGRRLLGAVLQLDHELAHRPAAAQDHRLPRHREQERTGVDETEHAETSYDLGTLGAGLRGLSYAGSAPNQVEEESKNDQEVSA